MCEINAPFCNIYLVFMVSDLFQMYSKFGSQLFCYFSLFLSSLYFTFFPFFIHCSTVFRERTVWAHNSSINYISELNVTKAWKTYISCYWFFFYVENYFLVMVAPRFERLLLTKSIPSSKHSTYKCYLLRMFPRNCSQKNCSIAFIKSPPPQKKCLQTKIRYG